MASDNHASYFRIGLTVFLGTAAIAATLVYFGGIRGRASEVFAETYSDKPVSGLSVGSPVNFRGVKVGEVRGISFVGSEYRVGREEDNQTICIRMAFQRELLGLDSDENPTDVIGGLVARGLRATVTASGITGLSRIELDFPPDRAPPPDISWTPASVCIPPAASLLDNFSDSATRVMSQINRIDFRAVCADVVETLGQVAGAVSNANLFTANANALLVGERGRIGEIIGNLRSATAVAVSAASNAEELVRRADAMLAERRGDVEAIAANVRTASERAVAAVERLDALSDRAQGVVTAGGESVESILAEVRSAASAIREFAEEIRSDPSLLLRADDPAPLPETER